MKNKQEILQIQIENTYEKLAPIDYEPIKDGQTKRRERRKNNLKNKR